MTAPTLGTRVIAVTGASGFVGRRLMLRLRSAGWPTIALSRRDGPQADKEDPATGVDYSNVEELTRLLTGVDALIHLAARAHQPGVKEGAAHVFRHANVEPTVCLARACIAAGVRRFVLVSSIGVNGNQTSGKPFSVDDTPRPTEAYARSKWEAELELAAALRGHPVEYVVVRPPLVYGPGCPGNFASLLRLVARAPLVPLGGLDARRSFLYIDNLVDALLVAAHHPSIAGRTFLLADERDVSVAEVVRELATVLRPGAKVVINVPSWALSVLARLAGRHESFAKLAAPLQVDASAFRNATGWRAAVDPAEGLQETARQFRLA